MKFTMIRTGDQVTIRSEGEALGAHLFLGFTGLGGTNGVEPRFQTLADVKLATGCRSLVPLRQRADANGVVLQARFLRLDELVPSFAFLDVDAIWIWSDGGSVSMQRVSA